MPGRRNDRQLSEDEMIRLGATPHQSPNDRLLFSHP
jgi:hypothetical protein